MENGVGILAYASAIRGGDDYEGFEPSINGSFYVSEALFSELVATLRADTANDCSITLRVGPVRYETGNITWDVQAHPHLSVASVEFSFIYNREPQGAKPSPTLMERIFR